jgi:FlaA1/EpsC-like NDP-sugar epimerase
MKVLGHYVYVPIALLVVGELAGAALVFGACAMLLGARLGPDITPGPLALWMAVFGTAVVVGVTAVGLYQAKQRLRLGGVIVRVAVGLAIAATILAVVDFVFPIGVEGRLWVVSFMASFVLVSAIRVVTWRWLDHEVFRRRVLVYGAGTRAANLLKLRRQSDRRGFNIVAFVLADGDSRAIDDERVTTIKGSLLEFAKAHDINEIVVSMDDRRGGFPRSGVTHTIVVKPE